MRRPFESATNDCSTWSPARNVTVCGAPATAVRTPGPSGVHARPHPATAGRAPAPGTPTTTADATMSRIPDPDRIGSTIRATLMFEVSSSRYVQKPSSRSVPLTRDRWRSTAARCAASTSSAHRTCTVGAATGIIQRAASTTPPANRGRPSHLRVWVRRPMRPTRAPRLFMPHIIRPDAWSYPSADPQDGRRVTR